MPQVFSLRNKAETQAALRGKSVISGHLSKPRLSHPQIPSDIQATSVSPSPTGVTITCKSHSPWSISADYPHQGQPLTHTHPPFHGRSSNRPHTIRHYSHSRSLKSTFFAKKRLFRAHPCHSKILWNSSIAKSPPIVEYASLVPSASVTEAQAERGVLRWLTKVVR